MDSAAALLGKGMGYGKNLTGHGAAALFIVPEARAQAGFRGGAMIGVLFVCTGNICRSPTAEGVFRAQVARAGLTDRIAVDSAGTHAYHVGEPPDARASAAARTRGIALDDLRGRQVTAADFTRFDWILAMDRGHLRLLEALRPAEATAALRLFLEFAPALGRQDVPDPYYGGQDGFERVLDMIEAGSRGLLAHLRATLP
jgi:protein-tyrosine phosphatase